MARELWLLRHGEAEAGGGKADEQRELTPEGERQSIAAGRALARLGAGFEIAFTSPRVRARETARLACEALGPELVVHEPLSAEFDGREALVLLGPQRADARVLVVGHQPDFSQVVHDLTGARIDLEKGGVAVVRVDGAGGELVSLLGTRELTALAKAPLSGD